MKIIQHLLYGADGKQVSYQATPNKGGKLAPSFLVIHYTAVTRASGSVSWFLDRTANASAHLLIDRDGSIVQFAPFDVVTWHAGESRWNGISGLNKHSIGIELVNGGRLSRSGNTWICPVDKRPVPDNDVYIGRHKNEQQDAAWHEYTEEQLQVTTEIGALLVKTYGLKDVVGHDDISPIRKSDPGPAFPMSSFRAKVMGRKDDALDTYLTSTNVNIRKGPGTQYDTLAEALPANTKVEVLKREGNWSFVDVLAKVHNINDLEGWVHTKYLVK